MWYPRPQATRRAIARKCAAYVQSDLVELESDKQGHAE